MKITIISEPNHVFSNRTSQLLSVPNFAAWWQISKCCEMVKLCYINSFAADFLAPSAGFLGVKIWKQAIPLTFVNTATIIANGTEGVLSTLVANGTGTVSTIVANGSERVNVSMIEYINGIRASVIDCGRVREIPSLWAEYSKILNWNIVYRKLSCCWDSWRYDKISDTGR